MASARITRLSIYELPFSLARSLAHRVKRSSQGGVLIFQTISVRNGNFIQI
jgi:hypothetical protein